MDVALLIDSIVRQTTVLIAQLATAGGARTPLSDVAQQVFRDLADELHRQGVSRKVAADMFGVALCTYRRRLQRFAESRTVAGRSLWEAVHEHVNGTPGVTRSELLRRFHRDDEPTLKAVLTDLVESGLLYRSGRGGGATYRAVGRDESTTESASGETDGKETLVWGTIYRAGSIERTELGRRVSLPEADLARALERLIVSGRVTLTQSGADQRYAADTFVVPLGSPIGWEAAVFDHFQALVGTVLARLGSDSATASSKEQVGGSTYTFEIWRGHPFEDEVLGELAALRARLSALRGRVAQHNQTHRPPNHWTRVVVYGGQNVFEMEDEEDVAATH
jgi:hypothetical protein